VTLIDWSPALSVGVQRFDDQHRVLVGMINDLHQAMAEGKGSQVLQPTLLRLRAYVATHFADEEALLDGQGYPGLADHAEQHRLLAEKVDRFQQEYRAGKVLLSLELMAFLKAWLEDHIKVADAGYGKFLNSKGIR
jgi:methyl-accepting chemotaxis protein/hemerythrin